MARSDEYWNQVYRAFQPNEQLMGLHSKVIRQNRPVVPYFNGEPWIDVLPLT